MKSTKFEKTQTSNPKIRQLNAGDRVQARYYNNNKAKWKMGQIIKEFGQLHYLVRPDCSYVFKRHINPLYKANVKDSRKSVSLKVLGVIIKILFCSEDRSDLY